MPSRNGGDVVAEILSRAGVTHVFGVTSVHNLPIYDAIDRTPGMQMVRTRHEQGATHAADAFARATGGLGVVLTSTGPGAANAVAGLYEAQYGSSPVLMITGQIETRFLGKGKGFLHEAERQVDMLRSVTRRAESVRRVEDIGPLLDLVIRDIRSGRPQPGAIEIPIDLQYAPTDAPLPPLVEPHRQAPDAALLERAAGLLSGAARPLIWAGGGVISADASAELTALAERLDAPVFTSVEGRGAIPEDHPLALGARTERAAMAPIVAGADVVLAVGTRFQNYATKVWQLQIPGTLIHLDADPGVIGRNYPAAVPLLGDARVGLEALLGLVAEREPDEAYRAECAAAVEADLAQSLIDNGPDHTALAAHLRDLLPRDAMIVRDNTVPAYLWGNRTFPIYEPRTSIRPSSLAIGPGVSLAIGAAFGSGRRTVVIQGDGGLMLSVGELATIAEYDLPIVVCVFNDKGYGVLRAIEPVMLDRHVGVDLHTPDFAALAQAMGMPGESVVGLDAFGPAFRRALDRPGPTLLDIDLSAMAPQRFPLPAHYNR